jgi:hypothetical protein
MPVRTTCPGCRARLRAPDRLAGATIPCPKCGGRFAAGPEPTEPPVDEHLFDFGEPEVSRPEPFFRKGDRLLGGFMNYLGIFLGVGALVALVLFWLGRPKPPAWHSDRESFPYALYLVSGACTFVSGLGWYLCLVGERVGTPGAGELMEAGARRPILLLRAFREDATDVHHYGKHGMLWVFGAGRKRTFEQTVHDVFSPLGPLIAIGRPGEELPPLGASRLWVNHAEWQQRVDQLLGDCLFVVLIMGPTTGHDGLAWEARRVFQLPKPKKVILLLPPLPDAELKPRWEKYRELSGGRLPPFEGGELLAKFSRGWKCHVTRIRERRTERAYRANVTVWTRV